MPAAAGPLGIADSGDQPDSGGGGRDLSLPRVRVRRAAKTSRRRHQPIPKLRRRRPPGLITFSPFKRNTKINPSDRSQHPNDITEFIPSIPSMKPIRRCFPKDSASQLWYTLQCPPLSIR